MGVRLKYEADNFFGDEFEVLIVDNDYSGAVIPITGDLQTASFNFNGEAKNRLKTICTTQFSITLFVTTAAHETFFYDLALQQEGRFFVKVMMYDREIGALAFQPIFIGHLVMDEVFLQNGEVSALEIKASDGLNRLTDQEFISDTLLSGHYGSTYYFEGKETIHNIIYECLKGVGTIDLYDSSPYGEFLWVNHHWYESNHSSTTIPPLENIRIDHTVFTRRDDEDNYITNTKAYVLEKCLNFIGCRIRYLFGTYIIENLNDAGTDSRTYFCYDKDGTYAAKFARANWFYDLVHPFTDGSQPFPLAGGKFGILPPLRKVCVNFNYTLRYGLTPYRWGNDSSDLFPIGEVYVVSDSTSLFVKFGIEYEATIGQASANYWSKELVLWFGLTIKFGSYYYVTTETEVTYSDTLNGQLIEVTYIEFANEWSATPGVYLIKSERGVPISGHKFVEFVELDTLPLESIDGVEIDDLEEVSVKVEFLKVSYSYNKEHTDILPSDPTIEVEWRTNSFQVVPSESGDRVVSNTIGVSSCVDYDRNNSTHINIDTAIGDASVNSTNNLQVHNGTSWVNSDQLWGDGTLAGTLKIQDLLLNRIIAGQPSSLRRYIGSFRAMRDPRYFFKYDGSTFIPLEFSYGLFFREWNGEFCQFVDNPQSITITNNGIQASDNGVISTAGQADSPGTPAPTETIFPFDFEGTGTVYVPFGNITLPSKTELTVGQINYLLTVYKENVRAWFGDTGIQGFDIDNASNRLVFDRVVRVGERIKGYLRQLN